jgi:hypothetical protein
VGEEGTGHFYRELGDLEESGRDDTQVGPYLRKFARARLRQAAGIVGWGCVHKNILDSLAGVGSICVKAKSQASNL